ncbi:ankyrin repeat and MYND domain-containing protein 1 [Astyanax mexicanus]|uniref:Ankyrin repeat and MYND domain containing 1 n=1 Tax=Astyanax mexicanus TaxID=7994 RepID=A0A8B9KVK8_ASTMX|nr:ankyrin repeat and MYND domain-containing protein 1 [Astyanax mexicanus]
MSRLKFTLSSFLRKRNGEGVQQWPDGSRYEGQFVEDLKHGHGVYTWPNGQSYEGSFYKDFRHGSGTYIWPDGSRFTGKFYLNRKEGYGVHVFRDGTTFQGLFHADKRFGPGVITYVDGRQDVGVWYRKWLFRLCTRIEGAFTLQDVPGYTSRPSKHKHLTQNETEISTKLIDTSLLDDPSSLEDDGFILPPDIFYYCTDSDHLPITHSLRKELDLLFFGSSDFVTPTFPEDMPLQLRIKAHINVHRFEAIGLSWEVAAVLAMNREPFGPKGPLELSSERFIREASLGVPSAIRHLLKDGNIHPDVSDAGGFTALIAATVNCHDEVIHLLLDSGADVDKLNEEGMSALAVCAVLYYPFQSLIETEAERTPDSPHTPGGDTPKIITSSTLTSTSLEEHEGQGDTGSQTGPLKPDSLPEHFSCAVESKASEPSEDSACPNKAEMALQDTESQAVEAAELLEEAQLNTVSSSLQVLDGNTPVDALTRQEGEPEEQDGFSKQQNLEPKIEAAVFGISVEDAVFDSACSVASLHINVTEGIKQQMAEVLCQAGHVKPAETLETVRVMALMKTERQSRWSTLNLLLNRGSDPNISSVPMPVIFLSIKAGDVEGVRRLLECGARTDLPLTAKLKGLYPLHMAAGLPGPEGPKITQMLLHGLADPDAKAQDASEVFHLDRRCRFGAQVGYETSPITGSRPPACIYTSSSDVPEEGGRTPLHVACQRDSDFSNARDVVSTLLSHKASTNHLWSGHSPLSLAIASGNDLAVDELLAAGADPNLPLSRHVGSALCAAANFSYDCGSKPHNRLKLIEKLIKAGANILMPVVVGEGQKCTVGTAVDYAYYQFKQDQRICDTPYHVLNQRERETYSARRKLLDALSVLLRQAVISMEKQHLEEEQSQDIQIQSVSPSETFMCASAEATSPQTREQTHRKTAPQRKPLFKYCYQCGRSVWVVLTACSRCRKVFYCSKTCKMKAWNERHKEECILLAGTGSVGGRYFSGEPRCHLTSRSSKKGQERAKNGQESYKKGLSSYKKTLEKSKKGLEGSKKGKNLHLSLEKPDLSHSSAHRHKHDPKENYSFI